MHKYAYSLVRYIHDPVREEILNVGILFYSQDAKFIKFMARKNLADFKHVFPDFSARLLKQQLVILENSFNNLVRSSKDDLFFKDIHDLAHRFLPFDASSLQWAKGGSGSTKSLDVTFEELSERFVQQERNASPNRTDRNVWKKFSTELKKRELLSYFVSKTVHINGFEETYEHAYKNGKLHCLRPLSLDMASEEAIREKVLREAGRFTISNCSDENLEFKFYFLLGKPSNPDLAKDFTNARLLLERSVTGSVVFTEDEAEKLPDYIEDHLGLRAQKSSH